MVTSPGKYCDTHHQRRIDVDIAELLLACVGESGMVCGETYCTARSSRGSVMSIGRYWADCEVDYPRRQMLELVRRCRMGGVVRRGRGWSEVLRSYSKGGKDR